MEVLAATGGRRMTDTFHIVEAPIGAMGVLDTRFLCQEFDTARVAMRH